MMNMVTITPTFLKQVFGGERIKGSTMLSQAFEKVLYVYKGRYPMESMGNQSATQALFAKEFVLNAELYFARIGSTSGSSFFNQNRSEFTKHFNYDSVLREISQHDRMLFLFSPSCDSKRKLSANGVIGWFRSIDHTYGYSDENAQSKGHWEQAILTVRLEISNKGIIDLPVSDMEYFEKGYEKKIEIVI